MLTDLRVLSTALGFIAVAMKEENIHRGGAERAIQLANLIEQFCKDNAGNATQVTVAADRVRQGGAVKISGQLSCEHWPQHSVIFVPANEDSAVPSMAEIRSQQGFEARVLAEFFANAVNDNARKDAVIAELVACLELCLESGELSWEAEHDATIMIERVKSLRNS